MDDAEEDVIFDRRADKVARPVFIKGQEKRATPQVIAECFDFPNTASAHLMRHEGICFAVYGENMIIPLLLQAFGARGLLDLLEQKAIRFWLERDQVMYLQTPAKGVNPLVSGSHTTAVHSDPEESVAEALRRRTRPLEAKIANKLKGALAEAYVTAPESFAPGAVEFGHQGYQLGRFKFAGLDPAVPFDQLDEPGRATLARLAAEMHDLSLIARLRMNTIDEFAIARVCHDSVDRLRRGRRLESAYQRVLAIEDMPDVAQLFRSKVLDVRSLPTLRQKPDAIRFRRWMREVTGDPHSADAGAEYLKSLAGAGFWESKKGRLVKTLTVSAVLGGAGQAFGGPVAALVGAAAPTTLDVGLDVFDEFVLGAMLSGWKPRSYFENVLPPR